MAIVRRWGFNPGAGVLGNVESVNIIDLSGPSPITSAGVDVACLVGEFLKGPFTPREVSGSGDLLSTYGGYSSVVPHADVTNRADGNGLVALARKKFARLVISRVDTRAVTAASGATVATITLRVVNAGVSSLAQDLVLPAGFRLSDAAVATRIVCLAQDYTVPRGSDLTGAGFAITTVEVFFATGVSATAAGANAIDTALDSPVTFGFPTSTTLTVNTGAVDLFIPAAVSAQDMLSNRYLTAIDRTLPGDAPTNEITIIWSARSTGSAGSVDSIRDRLRTNAVDSSASARGRRAILRAQPGTAKPTSNATAETAFGSGNRSRRCEWVYPHVRFNPVLTDVITFLDTTDTTFPAVGADSFMASILATLPPENNPGEPALDVLQNILGYEIDGSGNNPTGFPLVVADFINFRTFGMAVLRRDQASGWEFQSGITSVNPAVDAAGTEAKRTHMADFINDSLAAIAARFSKKLATTERRAALLGEYDRFLSSLRSRNNAALQRVTDYRIDGAAGNTVALNTAGIYVDLVLVQLLNDMRSLVIQSTIGETVNVTVLD